MKSYKEYKEKLNVIANKSQNVDVLVIDSFTSLCEFILIEARNVRSGFDIFSYYNDEVYKVIDNAKELNFPVVFIGIDLIRQDQKGNETRMIKVEGKKLVGQIEKEFVIVLYSVVLENEPGKYTYNFLTNNDGIRLAKSPEDMFTELYIPNDLNYVLQKVNEYYNYNNEETEVENGEIKSQK